MGKKAASADVVRGGELIQFGGEGGVEVFSDKAQKYRKFVFFVKHPHLDVQKGRLNYKK